MLPQKLILSKERNIFFPTDSIYFHGSIHKTYKWTSSLVDDQAGDPPSDESRLCNSISKEYNDFSLIRIKSLSSAYCFNNYVKSPSFQIPDMDFRAR